MSVRPLDMTITLQRSTEINRSQTGEHVRPEVSQQQFADKLSREVQQQDQQVIQRNKAEDGKIDRDGRGSDGGASKRKKRERKENKNKAASKQSGSSMFDVSV